MDRAAPLLPPLGWSVSRLRGSPQERERRLAALARDLEQVCEATFAGCRGVSIRTEAARDRVRVDVARGELEGAMVLTTTRDRAGVLQGVHLRAMARARSVQREILAAPGRTRRAQALGLALGAAVFVAMCALTIGVHAPVFVLSGMLMVVVLLALALAGSGLATWAVHRRQAERMAALRAGLRRDGVLRADLGRLRAAARRLARHRELLAGGERTPFRSAAAQCGGGPEGVRFWL